MIEMWERQVMKQKQAGTFVNQTIVYHDDMTCTIFPYLSSIDCRSRSKHKKTVAFLVFFMVFFTSEL
jgi:hypothetical protein